MSTATPAEHAAESRAEISSARDAAGRLVISLSGRLDAQTTGSIWREAMSLVAGAGAGDLVVDASEVDHCDGAGAGLLLALSQRQASAAGGFELRGLRDDFRDLLELLQPSAREEAEQPAAQRGPFHSAILSLGRGTLRLFSDARALVVFVGELSVMLVGALRRPGTVRTKDVFIIAERAGIGALPIVTLIGFLLGLILAFQSAIPMQRFGAQIFVADLLSISLLRELGPLMAAILLAARSGSAFAAELGTMKVNEEVDALTTMGLEPVRFLVVPRVIAAVAVVPVLAMVMNIAGLLGGAVVFLSLDFPLITYWNRVVDATSAGDLLGGLFKALVFGLIVASIGCQRGLKTGTGAGAVGESTTSSVVSGITLIAVADGLFAVLFYILGI